MRDWQSINGGRSRAHRGSAAWRLREILDVLSDGDSQSLQLTAITQRKWPEDSHLLVDQVCWLRDSGVEYPEIAAATGIGADDAEAIVRLAEPSLA